MSKAGGFSLRRAALALGLVALFFALLPLSSARAAGGGATVPGVPTGETAADDSPFAKHGMWIWYIDRSEDGVLAKIVARAKRAGVGTVYVKSGDAGNYWSQFSKAMINRLHAGGLDVCAWQFVYGDSPLAEAKAAAAAVNKGADCFAIDAEGHYEGKYASADRYVRALRARIGAEHPVSLATFPYVDYHPSFPYSVFLGPGGAQYNQPQMYWRAIGETVRSVFEHTYLHNTIYEAPIYPIGQTYGVPNRKELTSFRRFSASYGNLQPSWWSWQETNDAEWGTLGSRAISPVAGYQPVSSMPLLRKGASGDQVVWAQQHLVGAGNRLPVTGIFGKLTRAAVRNFQTDRGIVADGVLGQRTWRALLKVTPKRVKWGKRAARASRLGARARVAGGGLPLSASLPARAYEIDPGPGR